jgi:sec-independent protein translocase protein TatC
MRQRKNQKRKTEVQRLDEVAKPFIEHLYELRKRLVYVVGSILFFSAAAYLVQQHIVNFLLRPSHHQQFIYTSPGGGINFLFSVCLYVGIAASTPIIVYQILAFLKPLIQDHVVKSIVRNSFLSAVLAGVGFLFGYYIGLPAALHFLSNQFTTQQIHPLFTIQEYLSFLTIYLLGSMLLFQLPIILIFIDHIKPFKPRKLFKFERYVIVAAFIISMIMAPTANIFDQLIIAGPIIVMYNLTIGLLWFMHKRNNYPQNVNLLNLDDPKLQPTAQPAAVTTAPRKLVPNKVLTPIKPVYRNRGLIMDIMPSSSLSHLQK